MNNYVFGQMKSVFNSGALRRGLALTVLLGLLGTLHAGAQCVPTVSGIVGWWPGDGNANDITGTNNGTLQGGATASGPGFVAQGFTFDGTNSFVSIPDSPVLKPANLTIEAWILFRSLDSMGSGGSKAGQQYIVFKQNTRSGNFEGYYLAKQRGTGGDFFTFGVTSSAGVEVAASGAPGSVATNVWYHVAAVRGPSTVQLFVNGQLISQASVSFPQDYGTFPVFFGTSGQSYWDHKFNGSLDEVSLYNRALTSNEIAAIYAAGAAGKCKTVGAPVILTPPQSQTVAVGSNALFNVSVGGVTPFSYQWMLGSAPIASATGSSLTVSNAQLTDAGNYSVIVTNSIGSATSSVAVLTVLTPPGILTNPQSFTNAAGGAAMFSATAGGSAPLTYQWTFNGNNLSSGGRITGATSNVLTITGLTTTDAGGYALKVSNPVGVATSSVATLVVLSPPVVGNNPSSQTVTAGSNASFTVTASGTAPLGYQWRFNGANLSDGGQFNGSATPTLSITSVQTNNAGGYSVVVTNSIGSATSAVATLTVNVPGSCLPPPQGMIGWWPGEGSAADIVGPDNGILQGGATATASGEVGQAFSFDGTNNFVQIPDSPLLHPTNLTIEAWVRFTGLDSYSTGGSPPGDQYIVFKQNTRSGNFEGFDLSKTRFSNGDGFRFAVSSQLGVALEVDSTTRVTV